MPEQVDQGKDQLKKGFKGLLSKIGSAIEDAATLEVTTFSGNFEYKASDVIKNNVNKVQIENVLKTMATQSDVNLTLVAYTNVKIDSDVTTFVKGNLTSEQNELLALHKDMLESSKEARQSVINLVKGLIKA
ncbi:MAG: hypothetical protein HEP71_06185 [Roseivirga sp.]|nr:hypothetical protein [Roseivirga sp.]